MLLRLLHKAGYSRATFYHYFKDVYDLLDYIEDEFIMSLMKRITTNIEQGLPMDCFIRDFASLIRGNRIYIRLFMDRAKSSAFIEKLKDKALPLMCKAFGLAEQDKAKRYVLEFYISGVVPVISSWMNRQDVSEESLAEMINGILHEGIISQLKQ